MSLLCTLSRSSKLLRVPRVYNALVYSDEDLRSSQAYPVFTPVVQGFLPSRYASSNVYRTFSVPNYQVQYSTDTHSYSYSVQNTVKEDHYHYNVLEPGLPIQYELPMVSAIEVKSLGDEPILFIRNGNAAKIYDGRFVDFDSSPIELEDDNPPEPYPLDESNVNDVRLQRAHRYRGAAPTTKVKGVGRSSLPNLKNKSTATETKEPKTDTDSSNQSIEIEDVVKNNRPKNKSIVDVPPPPIPIRWKQPNIKKPSGANRTEEEYPPPPVGFI